MNEESDLLERLKELPPHAEEPAAGARARNAARAAYANGFAPAPWLAPLGRVQRAIMPVVLIAFVGLYMTWAFASATALLHEASASPPPAAPKT